MRFKLRRGHIASMDALMAARLEDRLVAHVRRCFVEEVAGLSDDDLRKAVRAGIERARRWGFESELHLCQFVDLSVLLGGDFDCNPRFPWAGSTLGDRAIPDAKLRMNTLWARALGELPHLKISDRRVP